MENIEFEGFIIDNDTKADWAVRKIKNEERELERLEFIADSLIEETKLKLESERKSFENKTNFLKTKLYEYFSKVETKKTKTQEKYKLLSGSLIKKLETQSLEIKDKEELKNWLKENGYNDFIKVKEETIWGDWKKNLVIKDGQVIVSETGEILNKGVQIVEKPAVFEVK